MSLSKTISFWINIGPCIKIFRKRNKNGYKRENKMLKKMRIINQKQA